MNSFLSGYLITLSIYSLIVSVVCTTGDWMPRSRFQGEAVEAGHAEFYREEVTGPLKWRWMPVEQDTPTKGQR